MTEYVCEKCGKRFNLKMLPSENRIWCKACKLEETYRSNPGSKQESLGKKKETFLKKYGVDNPSKSLEIQEKLSRKAKERFEDPLQKEKILSKRASTNIKKYGFSSASRSPEVIQKNVETQLSNKGYVGWQNKTLQESAQKLAHSEEANRKRIKTSLQNYGATHHFKNKEVLSKQWSTYKEKTGYDHPSHNPDIIHSIKGYLFEDIHFDSSWELAYYIWLRDNGKSFIYHPPFYLDYLDSGNESHQYQPDFLVEGQFIEIKGDQFFNEKGEPFNSYTKSFWWCKYNALKENKIVIKRFDELRDCLRYVKEKYGKDYLKSFKRK